MKAIAITILCLVSMGLSNQTDFLFQQGVDAYQAGDYGIAIERFESALQHGRESAALYFNLGNAYYKTDDIARAIVNYERAKKLNAYDDDINFNLQIAQLSVVDKIPTPEMDYFFKFWQRVKNGLSLSFLTLLTLGAYILLIGLWIMKLLIKRASVQNVIRYTFTPTLIALVLGSLLFGLRVREDLTIHYGVILEQKIAITSSPSEDATEVFALHEGVKVKIIARSGEFSRIRLSDGKDGWVATAALEVI